MSCEDSAENILIAQQPTPNQDLKVSWYKLLSLFFCFTTSLIIQCYKSTGTIWNHLCTWSTKLPSRCLPIFIWKSPAIQWGCFDAFLSSVHLNLFDDTNEIPRKISWVLLTSNTKCNNILFKSHSAARNQDVSFPYCWKLMNASGTHGFDQDGAVLRHKMWPGQMKRLL